MRKLPAIGFFLCTLTLCGQTPVIKLWNELKTKRENLPGVHQEFQATTATEYKGQQQGSKWDLIVEFAPGRWREQTAAFGAPIRVFDGKDVYSYEEDDSGFVKTRQSAKEPISPSPYQLLSEIELPLAAERQRVACIVEGETRPCVVLEAPLKGWMRFQRGQLNQLTDGHAEIVLDTVTGLMMSARTIEFLKSEQCTCRRERTFLARHEKDGMALSADRFTLPAANNHEVKELRRWNATRIQKSLAGKPAPPLSVSDMAGMHVDLADLSGQYVLLDFWATWCPPCRADAPVLQSLYERYKDKNLALIAISVSEDRKVVEKYLKKEPVHYPVALSSETELAHPYQVEEIPTYVVIGPDGSVEGATDGYQGLSSLKKSLEKAGFETK